MLDGLLDFIGDIFLPYLVGGILPGLIAAAICYWTIGPLVAAYQVAAAQEADEHPGAAAGAAGRRAGGLCRRRRAARGTMPETAGREAARRLRLGLNIDHVATVRNARGGAVPDPVRAAHLAAEAGADGITAHLREDRRHIVDRDIERLMAELSLPLNLEMAATDEMQAIALRHRPHAVCLVPERREERTTEGGLDVAADEDRLARFIAPLAEQAAASRSSSRRPASGRGGQARRRGGGRAAHRRLLRRLRRGPRGGSRRRAGAADRECGAGARSGARGPCRARADL